MSNEVDVRRGNAEEIQKQSQIQRLSKASEMAIVVGETDWHSMPNNATVLREIESDQLLGLTTTEAAKRLAL